MEMATQKKNTMSKNNIYAVLALILMAGAAPAATERVSIVSQTPDSQFVAIRTHSDLSADGRYVVFSSMVDSLVTGDNDGATDVFVRDRWNGTTERLLALVNGQAVSTRGFSPSISGDGRFVAFVSSEAGLVAGDTNGLDDVFVLDRETAAVERVSLSSSGGQGSLNGVDGTLAAFQPRVYAPTLSADGRFVAYHTAQSGLVSGDTNGVHDVFVHDRATRTTRRASIATSGAQASSSASQTRQGSRNAALSADGRWVAFVSDATNLVGDDSNGIDDVFLRDLQTNQTVRVSPQGHTLIGPVDLSADGSFVTYALSGSGVTPDDTFFGSDVFVYDRLTGATERVSVDTQGGIDPVISADGRYVAYGANSQILVRDRQRGATTTASVSNTGELANGTSVFPAISADGTVVTFDSSATNLVDDGIVAVRSLYANVRGAEPNPVDPQPTPTDPLPPAPENLLELSATQSATTVRRGNDLLFTFTVTNLSADTAATNLSLVATLPSQLEVRDITADAGIQCSAGLMPVCQLDALAAGDGTSVTITTRPRSTGTNLAVTASVSADQADAVLEDNTVQLNFSVTR